MDRVLLRATGLYCSQLPEDLQPILIEEVATAVAPLKKGKSAESELIQVGGETKIDGVTKICNKILRTGAGCSKHRLFKASLA